MVCLAIALVAVMQVACLVLGLEELRLECRLSSNTQGLLETPCSFLARTTREARSLDLDLTATLDLDDNGPQATPPTSTSNSTEPSSQDRSVTL